MRVCVRGVGAECGEGGESRLRKDRKAQVSLYANQGPRHLQSAAAMGGVVGSCVPPRRQT